MWYILKIGTVSVVMSQEKQVVAFYTILFEIFNYRTAFNEEKARAAVKIYNKSRRLFILSGVTVRVLRSFYKAAIRMMTPAGEAALINVYRYLCSDLAPLMDEHDVFLLCRKWAILAGLPEPNKCD